MLGAEVVGELDCCVTLVHNNPFLFVTAEVDVYEQKWLLLVVGCLFLVAVVVVGLFLLFDGLVILF